MTWEKSECLCQENFIKPVLRSSLFDEKSPWGDKIRQVQGLRRGWCQGLWQDNTVEGKKTFLRSTRAEN